MPSETKIKIDGGTLIKSDDGKVHLGKNAGCVSWLAVINSGILTLGLAVFMISAIPNRWDANDRTTTAFLDAINASFQGLSIILFLGYTTFYLYNKAKRGKITIDPTAKLITIGKREILFSDIKTIMPKSVELPTMKGAVLVTFYAVLKTEKMESLCSISGDPRKLDAPVAEIFKILSEALIPSSPPS